MIKILYQSKTEKGKNYKFNINSKNENFFHIILIFLLPILLVIHNKDQEYYLLVYNI